MTKEKSEGREFDPHPGHVPFSLSTECVVQQAMVGCSPVHSVRQHDQTLPIMTSQFKLASTAEITSYITKFSASQEMMLCETERENLWY